MLTPSIRPFVDSFTGRIRLRTCRLQLPVFTSARYLPSIQQMPHHLPQVFITVWYLRQAQPTLHLRLPVYTTVWYLPQIPQMHHLPVQQRVQPVPHHLPQVFITVWCLRQTQPTLPLLHQLPFQPMRLPRFLQLLPVQVPRVAPRLDQLQVLLSHPLGAQQICLQPHQQAVLQ